MALSLGELPTTRALTCIARQTAAVTATASERVTVVVAVVKFDVVDAARGKLATTFVWPLTGAGAGEGVAGWRAGERQRK